MSKQNGIIKYRSIVAKQDGVLRYPIPAAPAVARQDGIIRYVNRTARLNGVIDYTYSESTDPLPEPDNGAYDEDLLITPVGTFYIRGNLVRFSNSIRTGISDIVDDGIVFKYQPMSFVDLSILTPSNSDYEYLTLPSELPYEGVGDLVINVVAMMGSEIFTADSNVIITWAGVNVELQRVDSSRLLLTGVLRPLDFNYSADTYSVNRYPNYSERYVDPTTGYIPSGTIRVNNFKNTTHNGVIMNVKSGIVKPKYSAIVANSSVSSIPWEGSNPIHKVTKLTYGYGLQNFLVGGSTDLPFDREEYVPPEPVTIIHPEYEVFRFMSNATLYLDSDNSIVGITSCNVSYDLDTFTWKLDVTLASESDYIKVKPVGSIYQTVELKINDVQFKFFISNVARDTTINASGKISRQFNATGFSLIKSLAAPHAGVRTYAEQSERAASQLVQQEVVDAGYGTVINWNSINWTVPFGVHSYQNKTPVGAMLDIVNAAGCAMMPDPFLDEVNVLTYYRDKPWNWNSIVPDHKMHINQFLNDSSDIMTVEVPNTVFVYGTGDTGVGVEVGLSGTQATNVLPDIVDKYITDTAVAVQRGTTELSKVSKLEEQTLNTYLDTTTGIFYPRQIIEVTDWDGSLWYCQVMGIKITMSRIGAVIIQSLTVHKYHES